MQLAAAYSEIFAQLCCMQMVTVYRGDVHQLAGDVRHLCVHAGSQQCMADGVVLRLTAELQGEQGNMQAALDSMQARRCNA